MSMIHSMSFTWHVCDTRSAIYTLCLLLTCDAHDVLSRCTCHARAFQHLNSCQPLLRSTQIHGDELWQETPNKSLAIHCVNSHPSSFCELITASYHNNRCSHIKGKVHYVQDPGLPGYFRAPWASLSTPGENSVQQGYSIKPWVARVTLLGFSATSSSIPFIHFMDIIIVIVLLLLSTPLLLLFIIYHLFIN